MKCPFCANDDTQVMETRETAEDVTRRRRECTRCKKRFTTYERQEQVHLRVIKQDGNRELFDRDKLKRGFLKACEKRPVTTNQIEELLDDIERKLRSKGKPEAKSSEIGALAMQKLRKLDAVAYIRFASVYKKFEDLEDFKKALGQMDTKSNNRQKNKIGGDVND
ncbi:transcriptional repressor NrdR [Candidatus Woesearchaeota archaeon]|nr:transcriptional repressor NrdR [Candidatus Woesearchaeota archaeon]